MFIYYALECIKFEFHKNFKYQYQYQKYRFDQLTYIAGTYA